MKSVSPAAPETANNCVQDCMMYTWNSEEVVVWKKQCIRPWWDLAMWKFRLRVKRSEPKYSYDLAH